MPNPDQNQNPIPIPILPKVINIVKLSPLDITDVVSLYLWKVAKFQSTPTSDDIQTFPVTLYIDSKTTFSGLLNDQVYNGSKDLLVSTQKPVHEAKLQFVV